MTAFVLGIPEHKVRVIAPDVGGGFGSKIFLYNEETVCTWATKQIKRPIRWTSSRREAFQTDAHGRDHVTDAEVAVSKDGKLLGLRVKTTANLGAYLSTFAPAVPTYLYATLLNGVYEWPAIHARGHRRLHQHHAGGRLPRGRPARGLLPARAHDGRGRGRAQDGPGRDPAEELHPEVRRRLPDQGRAVRTTAATTGARSTSCSACSTTRSSAPTRPRPAPRAG